MNNYFLLEVGKWILCGCICLLIVIILFYAFFGFLSWLFEDPFHWIQDSEPKKPIIFNEEKAVQVCIDTGGVPIKSGWTGLLKRCDFIK